MPYRNRAYRIHGGRPLGGRASIGGSKHSILHILGSILLLNHPIVIHNVPCIRDVLAMLKIYKGMGMKYDLTNDVLSVGSCIEDYTYHEISTSTAPELRSSILLLGSALLANGYVRFPLPQGDPIGVRPHREFTEILDAFSIPNTLTSTHIEASVGGGLHGDRTIDLANWGNNRTALAIILAAGNVGKTTILRPLPQPEILDLCSFLNRFVSRVTISCREVGLEIEILGYGTSRRDGERQFRIPPDKCEMGFWIAAATMTRGVIECDVGLSCLTIDCLGPLAGIQSSLLNSIGITAEVTSPSTFLIDARRLKLKPHDLIVPYDAELTTGLAIDVCLQFIPILAVASGRSTYVDLKYGRCRLLPFLDGLRELGIESHIKGDTLILSGSAKLRPSVVRGVDIRGAATLLITALGAGGTSLLSGVEHVERGYSNMKEKLLSLSGRIDEVVHLAPSNINDLDLLMDNCVRKICNNSRFFSIETDTGNVITVDNSRIELKDLLIAAFVNVSLRGIPLGFREVIASVDGERQIDYLSILGAGSDEVTVTIKWQERCAEEFVLQRNTQSLSYSLSEFLQIDDLPGLRFPPGRSLAPLPFALFVQRAKIIAELVRTGQIEEVWRLPPLLITVGITDECNFKCDICFRIRKNRPTGQFVFPNAMLESLVFDLGETGVKGLRFCGEGENTIHPSFSRALALAKVVGLNTFLITNGSMWKSNWKVLARCLDFCRVSFNASSSLGYAAVHGTTQRMHGQVIAGIRALVSERHLLNSGTPTIAAGCVVYKNNMQDYEDGVFPLQLTDSGVDLLVVKKDTKWDMVPVEKSRYLDIVKRTKASFPTTVDFSGLEFSGGIPLPMETESPIGLGCIVRCTRCNIDSFQAHSCVGVGDKYGELTIDDFATIWQSQERMKSLEDRRVRPRPRCSQCYWEDIHRTMGILISRELA